MVQPRGVELNHARTYPDLSTVAVGGAGRPFRKGASVRQPDGISRDQIPGSADRGRSRREDVASVAPLPGRPKAAAFFDLDKTIIAGSSALAFSRPFLREGLISRRAALRSGYAQLLLLLAGADEDTTELLRRQITELCAGWKVEQVRAIVADTLHEVVEPLVYAEATQLIATHRAQGDEVVVLSASGLEVVEPISALVGVDRCVATRMAVKDGRYTGEIEHYLYGEQKAQAARQIAAERGYRLEDCYAYTDSITDLPLLEAVGHPVAVNPDRALRRLAQERGWRVLTFSAPVRLRQRLRPAPTLLVGAALAAAVALVASLVVRRQPQLVLSGSPSVGQSG